MFPFYDLPQTSIGIFTYGDCNYTIIPQIEEEQLIVRSIYKSGRTLIKSTVLHSYSATFSAVNIGVVQSMEYELGTRCGNLAIEAEFNQWGDSMYSGNEP